ncbi:hypothetical protein OAH34_02205 [bacterium]|jgi:hypothetical protein|nr:hypothetical protein [bacterium]
MDRAFTSLDKGVFWVENEVILDGRDKKACRHARDAQQKFNRFIRD